MPHDARAVANYLLDYGAEKAIPVGPLALQKVLFFLHGWWLLKTSEPLIRQAFEAWARGPVVRVVYNAFNNTPRGEPITTRAWIFDIVARKRVLASSVFSEEEHEFIREKFEYYGRINAFDLVKMTHEPGGPWQIVWNEEIMSPGNIIDNFLIKARFDDLVKHTRSN